ncbi:hypothetical protein HMPREF1551_01881 [Capnocytophaga sp. oral taxon 863 str. F0517]|nr:hypothetical protein HMPREF1551_01881 [Capnocytophaga sp. oral taxon 863 str. F0517]
MFILLKSHELQARARSRAISSCKLKHYKYAPTFVFTILND